MTSQGDHSAPEEPAPGAEGMGGPHARREARRRIEARRALATNVIAYAIINLFLIGVWAVSGGGYFWPAWVLLGWGVGLVFHAWDVYFKRPISEQDVDREMRRRTG